MKLIIRSLLAVFALVLLPPKPADADVYRYLDEEGRAHYVTDPSNVPPAYRSQVETPQELPGVSKYNSPGPAAATPLKAPAAAGSAKGIDTSKKVEIFVTEECKHCQALEIFLNRYEISYTRYDIENSRHGARMYEKLGGDGVPFVKVGDATFQGFFPGKLMRELRRTRIE